MEKLRKFEGLSLEELEAQRVELLPDREEMQTITDNEFAAQDVTQEAVNVAFNVQGSVVG